MASDIIGINFFISFLVINKIREGKRGRIPSRVWKPAINYAKLGFSVLQTFMTELHRNLIDRQLPVFNSHVDVHCILV